MKPTRLQFGVRENTASSRQPASRRVVNAICFGKETRQTRRPEVHAIASTTGFEDSLHAASQEAATVDPRALVFATREGLPLGRWNLLSKHLKPAAKKLRLLAVTWHLLRHSHATMLNSVGTLIGTMQSLLGHSTPEITREIYLHAVPEEQRRAVESVERLVFGPKFLG
jgi:integrase